MTGNVVSKHEFKSKSNPDKDPYVVNVYDDGTMSCNCRGWINKKAGKERECTHTKQVEKMGLNVTVIPAEVEKVEAPPTLPVMRPNDGELEFMESDDTIVQLKYDGTYAFLIKKGDKVSMPGRSFKSDYTSNHPEFVSDALKVPYDFILCGEFAFFDNDGNDKFLTALAMEETWTNLGYKPKFIVFDVLEADGIFLADTPLRLRYSILDKIFTDFNFESFERIKDYKTIEEKKHAWEISREGIVIKKLDSTIKDGRSNEWRKVKKLKAEDFWGIGFTKGTGAREVTFGALMLANENLAEDGSLEYITKTSGFTNAQLEELLSKAVRNDNLKVSGKLPPKKEIMYFIDPVLVEVKYQRKTEDGSLIMPRFVKERRDITG